jgi:activator of 2-hydroxyglutaryl-CoA dehydratase
MMIKNYSEYLNDNFWKWFGDSKVVDDKGKPLVVYHGTSSDFGVFGSTYGYYKDAYYFSTTTKYAEHITKMKSSDKHSIMPVYLKIEKLKNVDWKISSQNVDRYLNSYEYLNELPDGIVGIDSGSNVTTYVVFKQENIKSAIGNNGNFNINNPNINENF